MTEVSKKLRVVVIIGTRPEAIKMAPVVRALQRSAHCEPIVVSTGQHKQMLQQVVDRFEIPVDHELDVMRPNQTLAGLTSRLVASCDAVLEQIAPDFVLVQGDTTSVLAASLTCFYRHIPIGHVEAGLRTGNLQAPFPEEANRVLAGRLVSVHYAPTDFGRQNLLNEGVDPERILVTGNTVIDALHIEVARQQEADAKQAIDSALASAIAPDWQSRPSVLITGHRRENFGGGFLNICKALKQLGERFPSLRFVYPVHLNPNVQKPVYELLADIENICLIEPQPYSQFVALMNACTLVLTDSGGVQEEAPGLGKPVLVMRETTERPEGVSAGTVKLVGTDTDAIVSHVSELLTDDEAYARMSNAVNPYGDGKAAPRIVSDIERRMLAEA